MKLRVFNYSINDVSGVDTVSGQVIRVNIYVANYKIGTGISYQYSRKVATGHNVPALDDVGVGGGSCSSRHTICGCEIGVAIDDYGRMRGQIRVCYYGPR